MEREDTQALRHEAHQADMRILLMIAKLAVLALLAAGCVITADIPAAAALLLPGISETALAAITPAGYKHAKNIPWKENAAAPGFRMVAFEDANEKDSVKSVILMLLSREKGAWRIKDTVWPHNRTAPADNDGDAPNYFMEMSRVKVGSRSLILVRTIMFGGGSDHLQYFDFYTVRNNKLALLKSFSHGRMDGYYFTVYKNAVYDADLVCKRGKRRGKSFVYTCYLNVSRYGYNGRALVKTGTERLHERQGSWILEDSYRFMSVEKALRQGEIFTKK